MLTVVGGVYRERVAREDWDEYLGSAGRAVETIVALGSRAELHTYLDKAAYISLENRNRDRRYTVCAASVERVAAFGYLHGLAPPIITAASEDHSLLTVVAPSVVAFGMIAGDARVEADYAVYDAQNTENPRGFRANGSSARHLAVVVNRHEAETMLGLTVPLSPEDLVRRLAVSEQADVVILKIGPVGSLVLHGDTISFVPPYRTDSVFKVGSGDVFVAAFTQGWIERKLEPAVAADCASRATAYYVQHRRPLRRPNSTPSIPPPLVVTDAARAREDGDVARLKIYLAGPFTLAQYWMIEEACTVLDTMGFEVLAVSPGRTRSG